MKTIDKKPLHVHGVSSYAVQFNGLKDTTPATFTYDATQNRYIQGGNFNEALHVRGITTCAGRTTGLYSVGSREKDLVIIDSPLRFITPAKGDFKIIDSLLDSFTACESAAESATQKAQLLAWIRDAVQAVTTGTDTGAPVLILKPQDDTPAGEFIVKHIIKPLLGDCIGELSQYYPCKGESDYKPITAQKETACLLYDPAACFSNITPARTHHLSDLVTKFNTGFTITERIHEKYYGDTGITFKPIYRAIIETCHELPFIDPRKKVDRERVCLLYVNKPILYTKNKTLDALAEDCKEQLPAFLHYLLNEMPESKPGGYISPTARRVMQRDQFIAKKTQQGAERIFYKIATILILDQEGQPKTTSRENTFSLFRSITKAAKAYNMPLPAEEWTPDTLQSALDICLKKYPAYLTADDGGGWMINLPAIEREILLS